MPQTCPYTHVLCNATQKPSPGKILSFQNHIAFITQPEWEAWFINPWLPYPYYTGISCLIGQFNNYEHSKNWTKKLRRVWTRSAWPGAPPLVCVCVCVCNVGMSNAVLALPSLLLSTIFCNCFFILVYNIVIDKRVAWSTILHVPV